MIYLIQIKWSNTMLESIWLKNFRRHRDIHFEFDDKFNLIHGRNNAGKSTIFYAIEYGLFGNVQGFKKISQLTHFNQKTIGVQIIFKGKDNERYKLQRMHRLSGKSLSAKGFFTLKKLVNGGEAYLLSSDHGDREEDLSLKLNQILGVTKRFFETGIHFYQGSVSEILKGDKKLDIVFGIRAAIALADEFKDAALEFERDIKSINVFQATLEQTRNEKSEYQKRLGTLTTEQENLSTTIQQKEQELSNFEGFKEQSQLIASAVEALEEKEKSLEKGKVQEGIIKKDLEEIINKYGSEAKLIDLNEKEKRTMEEINKSIITSDKNMETQQNERRKLDNEKVQIETMQKQKENIIKEIETIINATGNKENLLSKIIDEKTKLEKTNSDLSSLEEESNFLQDFFRKIEREKGDIEGILQRREASKDKPQCEYCGNPIDPSKIKEEIKICSQKLSNINEEIKKNEERKEIIKTELASLREDQKLLNNTILTLESSHQKIVNLEEKLKNGLYEELEKKGRAVIDSIKVLEDSLKTEKETLIELREKEKQAQQQFNETQSKLEHFKGLIKKSEDIRLKIESAEIVYEQERKRLLKTFMGVRQQLSARIEEYEEDKDEIHHELVHKINTIVQKIEKLEDNFSLQKLTEIKEEFKELIITKISELSTSINHLKEQGEKMVNQLDDIKNNIKRLDKDIAKAGKEIEILEEKEKIAQKYRKYQENFERVQSVIRENVCSLLEEQILELHRNLSTTDEFEKVHVDNNDYSLSITPHSLKEKEFYPAHLYEGGGHKLILGLSYKFSLGKIIGNAPFLLIDEPTEFMDEKNRVNLLSTLSTILQNNQVMLITHQDVNKINCKKKIEIN